MLDQSATECISVETGSDVSAAVIWLHGLGADGHDFEPIVPQLRLPRTPHIRFVFPHAPMRPVTINNGMVMRAWYDISGFDLGRRQDNDGIEHSAQIVNGLIQAEVARGLRTAAIVVAGFSQGGAIALHAGLRYPEPLAGILALSAYLPLADRLSAEAHEVNRKVPIMMAHGTADPTVPLPLAALSRDQLRQQGYTVNWHAYPMQHGVCPQELDDISAWLRARLPQG